MCIRDRDDILQVVSKWTGIPLKRMEQGEAAKLLALESEMSKTVVGQNEAVAAMWARIGLNVRVETMTKANFFPKVQNRDTSAFLAGWGGGATDAIFILKPVMHSRDGKGAGDSNYGNAKNEELDTLIDKLEGEMNLVERQNMINRATKLMQDEVHVIPLHRQMIPWASRKNVTVLHRPNNLLDLHWVVIK